MWGCDLFERRIDSTEELMIHEAYADEFSAARVDFSSRILPA